LGEEYYGSWTHRKEVFLMETLAKIVGVIVLVAGLIVVMALLFALPTMLLWNWLMPEIFGLKAITFWQALGLNILSGILFKSSSESSSKD
jgi:hypothetical protein